MEADSNRKMELTDSNKPKDIQMRQAGEAFNVAVTGIDLACDTVSSDVTRCQQKSITQCAPGNFRWVIVHEDFH